MTSAEDWPELRVGSETVRGARRGDAVLLVATGPPHPVQSPEARAAELLAALAPSLDGLRWCQQVHGRVLASLSCDPRHPLHGAACVGRGDGLITAEAGLGVLVWSADCVPVLLHGGGVVAAVHAGWRGIAAGVVGAAVRRIRLEYGLPAHELAAVIGPAIAACHYPVGDDVVSALTATGAPAREWLRDGRRVELRAAVAALLHAAGLAPPQVTTVGGCTACDARLASYRRDGAAAGRQWSLAFRLPSTVRDRLPLSLERL